MIYRAYRVPYAWMPQADKPEARLEPGRFRVPGASTAGPKRKVMVEGVLPYRPDAALCVLTENPEQGGRQG